MAATLVPWVCSPYDLGNSPAEAAERATRKGLGRHPGGKRCASKPGTGNKAKAAARDAAAEARGAADALLGMCTPQVGPAATLGRYPDAETQASEPLRKKPRGRTPGINERRRHFAIAEVYANLGAPAESQWQELGGRVSEIR